MLTLSSKGSHCKEKVLSTYTAQLTIIFTMSATQLTPSPPSLLPPTGTDAPLRAQSIVGNALAGLKLTFAQEVSDDRQVWTHHHNAALLSSNRMAAGQQHRLPHHDLYACLDAMSPLAMADSSSTQHSQCSALSSCHDSQFAG